jgi:MFS transporter, DHA1 family, inner membrane transport protein
MNTANNTGRGAQNRLLLWSLVIAVFATTVIDVIIPLFLVDIAKAFQVTPAVASQIRTFSAIAQVAPALLMGLLAVRFRAKSLLVVGVLCISLAAVGSYLATNLASMQLFYSFNGVGSVIVTAMALAIIGEFYPLERKAQAVAIITATGALGYVIGAPLSALISSMGGWRSTFTLLVLPISIAGAVFALYSVPSKNRVVLPSVKKEPYWRGFKEIFKNKSAVACLIFQVFFVALFAIGTFGIAFFKETFHISTNFGSWIMFGGASFGALGSLVSGRIINRCGRKSLAVIGSFVAGILAIVAFYMPNLWVVIALRFSSLWFWGVAVAAGASLMLEQVPIFRGSMMSLRVAFAGVGSALGVALGGAVLATFNYQTVALTLGAIGVVGSFILLLAAKDPCIA